MYKHLAQESSLLENMNEHHLLEPDSCYVELGAGRGGLSMAVCVGLGAAAARSSFLLVDRASNKKKVDPKMKEEGRNITRLKIDVKDLDLTKVPEILQQRRLVFIGKHMCGGGTDVSLKCALHLEHHLPKERKLTEGIVIALCCHSRCSWDSYINKPFITQLGFSRREFEIITKLSAWATCGRGPTNDKDAEREDQDDIGNEDGEEEDEHDHDHEQEGEGDALEDPEGPSSKKAKLETEEDKG